MAAEVKVLGNRYMPKVFDGTGRLEGFLRAASVGRVTITAAHVSEAQGYFLRDCARLAAIQEVKERYMILVVDVGGEMDKLGQALSAARISRAEWTWRGDSRRFFVRMWRIRSGTRQV